MSYQPSNTAAEYRRRQMSGTPILICCNNGTSRLQKNKTTPIELNKKEECLLGNFQQGSMIIEQELKTKNFKRFMRARTVFALFTFVKGFKFSSTYESSHFTKESIGIHLFNDNIYGTLTIFTEQAYTSII
jgi:hypothetical protein